MAETKWKWTNAKDDKDLWTARPPAGEKYEPRIKRLSKNSDGSYTFCVYRNNNYVDCDTDLEKAKVIAERGTMRPERVLAIEKVRKYLKSKERNAGEFAKLTEAQRRLVTDQYPWAVPKRSELEKTGVKAPRAMRGDMLTKQEKKAQDLPEDSVIKRLNPKNPKKENTDAWTRWELLFQHDGKTIGDFIRAHGNPTTLRNAVRSGHVSAEGVK